jgi:hypothetical protein
MDDFWVYENTRADGHKARIHSGACGHCNHGLGQRGGTRPDNGKWHGPASSLAKARGIAQQTGGVVSYCKACAPSS